MFAVVQCPCGQEIKITAPSQVDRKKYCSKACFYQYRQRPSGLTYEIKAENPTWFRKGHTPANKGKRGPTPANFKGDAVKYHALHDWVYRHRGRPEVCEHCGATEHMQWANKSHEYRRDLEDWLSLCRKCHYVYDHGHQGAARRAGRK